MSLEVDTQVVNETPYELNKDDENRSSAVTPSKDSDDENTNFKKHTTKRTMYFSDSDSGEEQILLQKELNEDIFLNHSEDSISSQINNTTKVGKSKLHKLRIRSVSTSSSDSRLQLPEFCEEKSRVKSKKNNLKQKFKNLLQSRTKKLEGEVNVTVDNDGSKCNFDEDYFAIDIIKQKIQDKITLSTSICDPDTSDEENKIKSKPKHKKKEKKSIKLTSPKPIRMSAKQAMENMQKIKSESNRMLREKEVSLPYHRPKAMSLKDIMSRRKPAVTSDGKALPIKMNGEQLKQYALSLEQRHKEIMELCKSDSEEEIEEPPCNKTDELTDPIVQKSQSDLKINDQTELTKTPGVNLTSDDLYDSIMAFNKSTNDNIYNGTEPVKISEDSVKDDIVHNVSKKISDQGDNVLVQECDVDKPEFSEKEIPEIIHDQIENSKSDYCSSENREKAQKNDEKSFKDDSQLKSLYYDESENIQSHFLSNSDPVKNILQDKPKEVTSPNLNFENQDDKPHKNNEKSVKDDSQLKSLYYDESENIQSHFLSNSDHVENILQDKPEEVTSPNLNLENQDEIVEEIDKADVNLNDFYDDIDLDDIDRLIENADIVKDPSEKEYNSPILMDAPNNQPKLTGAPGMVIDLEGNSTMRRKLSGVELLKERFTYYAKLRTQDSLEKEKERSFKPGMLHLKLRQELEEKIVEQKCLEWEKRLEEERQQQKEVNAVMGDDSIDDIDKVEAELEQKEQQESRVESEKESEEELGEEEELLEDDICMTEKSKKKNPLIDNEAEVSEDEEAAEVNNDDDDSEETSEEESSQSESEVEDNVKPKQGRILKAFEDSDDEQEVPNQAVEVANDQNKNLDNMHLKTDTDKKKLNADEEVTLSLEINDDPQNKNFNIKEMGNCNIENDNVIESQSSQDDELHLAQRRPYSSEDLFASQDSVVEEHVANNRKITEATREDTNFGTQTFSIMGSEVANLATQQKDALDLNLPEKLSLVCESQNDENLDAVVAMCSGSFTQNLVTSQLSQTGVIGEDILALCTGKFYDNNFISLNENADLENNTPDLKVVNDIVSLNKNSHEKYNTTELVNDKISSDKNNDKENNIQDLNVIDDQINKTTQQDKNKLEDGKLLKNILDELNEPDFDQPKLKYFLTNSNKENTLKNKFVIDSDDDDEGYENPQETKRKKKFKKRKSERRALQFSDDEEEEMSDHGYDDDNDEISDADDKIDKIVEYDSEENEVEVLPQATKKGRKASAFFEQEAELTSEDEWIGSGDEDERGLDRMEREEGDDDTFQQDQLQRELGQIHMRDVLDQDKREVRIIQELLFEDGDLGSGHRQRKFRWRHADGEDYSDTVPDHLVDSQEDFESEELWRKQRHEREVFLRQMQQESNEDSPNVSLNRSAIIKANLSSKTTSSLLLETTSNTTDIIEETIISKKTAKDVPSPKKSFAMFQQSYHGSMLSRGRGALARLAALASPLVTADDASKVPMGPSSKRNFVFTALTPDEEPKPSKRKARPMTGSPQLLKKMKTEDKKPQKNSILDHLK